MDYTIKVTYKNGEDIEVFFVTYKQALEVYFRQVEMALDTKSSVISKIELLEDGKVLFGGNL